MNKIKNVLDKLATVAIYFGIIYVFIFLILKAVGLINTPFWIEVTPLLFSLIGILGLIYKASNFVTETKSGLFYLRRDFDRIDKHLSIVENKVLDIGKISAKLDSLDAKITAHIPTHPR